MTFETTAAGNKNGSTRPKGTNCLSLHDRTSLPVFFVGQYTGKCGRLQYGIFNKNRRARTKMQTQDWAFCAPNGAGHFNPAFECAGGAVGFAKPHPPFRRPILFCLARNCNVQPLFLCAAKKKPLAVKRKRQRGSCVGTNSTSLILSAASGGQASSVPLFLLFPREPLRWVRVGALAPFAIPLKRPRRGLRPPSLDFPRSLVCAEIIFGFAKRGTDAYLPDRRDSRNTLRSFRSCLAWKLVCARSAVQPFKKGRPFVFQTSNIQRA